MKRTMLIKFTILILMLVLLSACDGGNTSFKRKAAKVPVELDGFSIVTNKYILLDSKKIAYEPLIKSALNEAGITYNKDQFIQYQTSYKDKYLLFSYRLKTDKTNPNQSHFVLGMIDVTSLEVKIIRTFFALGTIDVHQLINIFDGKYGLIKTKDGVEYVDLITNEVIKTFEGDFLSSDGRDQLFAYIDEELVVVSFAGPIITETRYVIDDVIYNQIKDDYLLSIRDKVAYNYKTGESSDYDQVVKDPFHMDEYTYEITFMGKTYDYDAFMGLSTSLNKINGYANEAQFVFNQTYFVETSNGSFLVLHGYFGGLMFLTSYTPYYYFKYEENTFKYIGFGDRFFDAF